MKTYPAIAIVEYSSIATGILAGDAMVKQAPITVLKAGTVHNGKFLVLIGGSVAAVEESFARGCALDPDQVVDSVILPDVHIQVHDAILGQRRPCSAEAVAVIETETVATTVRSADRGIKGARVDIVEIRLADDIGGKAFAIFTGKVEDVEAAVQYSKQAVTNPGFWINDTIIPRLHSDMAGQIGQASLFAAAKLDRLAGGEL